MPLGSYVAKVNDKSENILQSPSFIDLKHYYCIMLSKIIFKLRDRRLVSSVRRKEVSECVTY